MTELILVFFSFFVLFFQIVTSSCRVFNVTVLSHTAHTILTTAFQTASEF
jgi:hypothetical protein